MDLDFFFLKVSRYLCYCNLIEYFPGAYFSCNSPREFTMIGESMSDLAFCAGLRFRRCREGQFFAGGKANDRVSTWLAFSSFLGDTLCREIKMEPGTLKSDCSAGIFLKFGMMVVFSIVARLRFDS